MNGETRRHLADSYHRIEEWRYGSLVKGGLGFGSLALLPFVVDWLGLSSTFSVNILIITLLYAFVAQAWNIMSGYTGYFSFGHTAFFGIGAYTTQKLLIDFAVSPWATLLIGGLIAAAVGLLMGGVTFRYGLEGHYFALVTLAFGVMMRYVVLNIDALNGARGYYRPLPDQYASGPGLAAFQFESDLPYFFLLLGFLIIVTAVAWWIKHSWVGLYFFAIREDEQAAASLGVPVYRYKLLALAVSAFFTAWAGTFWSMYVNTIRPDTVFALLLNADFIFPAIIGGIGTLVGPIVGSFFLTPATELLRTELTSLPQIDKIVLGVVLILVAIYSPGGIMDWPARFRSLAARLIDRTTD